MKKMIFKKISDAEIQALVNNSIKEVILCETTTTRPVVTYNAETKEIVFGYKYPAYFFTYEEIAENINDTSRKLLSTTYQKVEDCGEYFEVTEYEPTDYLVEIDGEVENGVLHASGTVTDGVLSL
jgi:hypothetical protein